MPNCFTAIPDVWAGLFIAHISLSASSAWATNGQFLAIAAPLLTAGLAGFFAYAGGVALNDLVDVNHDREHRPERPIPSSRLSMNLALRIVAVCALLSMWFALTFGPAALVAAVALWGLIVAYNLLHKRIPALGLPLMGLTRGANASMGLVMGGFGGTGDFVSGNLWQLWMFPLVLAAYVLSISIVARLEKRFQLAVKAVPRMILGIALLDAAAVLIFTGELVPALLVAVWIVPAAWLSRRFAMS